MLEKSTEELRERRREEKARATGERSRKNGNESQKPVRKSKVFFSVGCFLLFISRIRMKDRQHGKETESREEHENKE